MRYCGSTVTVMAQNEIKPEPPPNCAAADGVKMRSPKPNRRSSSYANPEHRSGRPTRVRVVIAGPEQGGKSCIIKRYCEKRFVAKYLPTVGIDYGATRLFVDKREVSVHIFDTSGATLFSDVRNEFYRDAHGLLLVMDVTRRETFEILSDWVAEIKLELQREARGLDTTVCYLAANKCDSAQREVDEVEARLWADLHGFVYCETSASSGLGITDMFQGFFSQILRLAQSGLGSRTPKSGKRPVSTLGRARDRLTVSPTTGTPPPPEPSSEQAAVIRRLRVCRDPWEQLGVARGCGKEDINRAYRKLAMMLHPDKTEVAGAQESFKILGQARNFIS